MRYTQSLMALFLIFGLLAPTLAQVPATPVDSTVEWIEGQVASDTNATADYVADTLNSTDPAAAGVQVIDGFLPNVPEFPEPTLAPRAAAIDWNIDGGAVVSVEVEARDLPSLPFDLHLSIYVAGYPVFIDAWRGLAVAGNSSATFDFPWSHAVAGAYDVQATVVPVTSGLEDASDNVLQTHALLVSGPSSEDLGAVTFRTRDLVVHYGPEQVFTCAEVSEQVERVDPRGLDCDGKFYDCSPFDDDGGDEGSTDPDGHDETGLPVDAWVPGITRDCQEQDQLGIRDLEDASNQTLNASADPWPVDLYFEEAWLNSTQTYYGVDALHATYGPLFGSTDPFERVESNLGAYVRPAANNGTFATAALDGVLYTLGSTTEIWAPKTALKIDLVNLPARANESVSLASGTANSIAPSGPLTLNVTPPELTGAPLAFNATWLASRGFTAPMLLHEDGMPIQLAMRDGLLHADIPRFSTVYVIEAPMAEYNVHRNDISYVTHQCYWNVWGYQEQPGYECDDDEQHLYIRHDAKTYLVDPDIFYRTMPVTVNGDESFQFTSCYRGLTWDALDNPRFVPVLLAGNPADVQSSTTAPYLKGKNIVALIQDLEETIVAVYDSQGNLVVHEKLGHSESIDGYQPTICNSFWLATSYGSTRWSVSASITRKTLIDGAWVENERTITSGRGTFSSIPELGIRTYGFAVPPLTGPGGSGSEYELSAFYDSDNTWWAKTSCGDTCNDETADHDDVGTGSTDVCHCPRVGLKRAEGRPSYGYHGYYEDLRVVEDGQVVWTVPIHTADGNAAYATDINLAEPPYAALHGTVTIIEKRRTSFDVLYKPNPDFAGYDSFAVNVISYHGGILWEGGGGVLLKVLAVNDAPTADFDIVDRYGYDDQIVVLRSNAADVDGDRLSLKWDVSPLDDGPGARMLDWRGTIATFELSCTLAPRTFRIALTATDPAGLSATAIQDVTVTSSDADEDGLNNCQEDQIGTDPNNVDSDGDGDGLSDYAEHFGLVANPHSSTAWSESGGWVQGNDWGPATYKTDPTKKDSDGDGWDDKHEVMVMRTHPMRFSTDQDTVSDSLDADPWTDIRLVVNPYWYRVLDPADGWPETTPEVYLRMNYGGLRLETGVSEAVEAQPGWRFEVNVHDNRYGWTPIRFNLQDEDPGRDDVLDLDGSSNLGWPRHCEIKYSLEYGLWLGEDEGYPLWEEKPLISDHSDAGHCTGNEDGTCDLWKKDYGCQPNRQQQTASFEIDADLWFEIHYLGTDQDILPFYLERQEQPMLDPYRRHGGLDSSGIWRDLDTDGDGLGDQIELIHGLPMDRAQSIPLDLNVVVAKKGPTQTQVIEAFKRASHHLWDATNGLAYIHTIRFIPDDAGMRYDEVWRNGVSWQKDLHEQPRDGHVLILAEKAECKLFSGSTRGPWPAARPLGYATHHYGHPGLRDHVVMPSEIIGCKKASIDSVSWSQTLTHELLHYVFGVGDEYKGFKLSNGKWEPNHAECNSIMNDEHFWTDMSHQVDADWERYLWFSAPCDKTVHWKVWRLVFQDLTTVLPEDHGPDYYNWADDFQHQLGGRPKGSPDPSGARVMIEVACEIYVDGMGVAPVVSYGPQERVTCDKRDEPDFKSLYSGRRLIHPMEVIEP